VLEALGERMESLESRLTRDTTSEALQEIHRLKREIMFVRRAVWPLREVLSGMEREEASLISEQTEVYFRDVHDHTVQAIETIETYREMTSGLMDLYQSNVNLKLNNVMRVLTVISTIFLPLTFMAGVWGMNFVNMPELYSQYGYFAALALMALVGIAMVLMFKKRDWL
jgi:magnesium transporter